MAIQFIGSAIGTTTATLPAHQPGDLILVFLYNDNAAVIPGQPAGYTNVSGNVGSGNSNGHRICYKIAASGAESVPSVSGATQLVAQIYRGVDATNPIGGSAQLTNVADITYPAISMQVSDGTSWVAYIHGRRTGNQESAAVPPGTAMRSDTGLSTTGRIFGYDSNKGVTSSPQLVTGGNNTFRYRSSSTELRSAPEANPTINGTGNATLSDAGGSASGKLTNTARGSTTLASATSTGSGQLLIRGMGGATLAEATGVGTATSTTRGVAMADLAPATGIATARLIIEGAGSATLSPATGEASSSLVVSGRGATTLADATGMAIGTLTIRGAGSTTLAPAMGVAIGDLVDGNDGRGFADLAPAIGIGSGRITNRGVGASTLAPAVGIATADLLDENEGVGLAALSPATGVATARLVIAATGSATLEPATGTAFGSVTEILIVPPARRYITERRRGYATAARPRNYRVRP